MADQNAQSFESFIFNVGLDVLLTKSELACLRTLFEKANHLTDRETIASELWGKNWPEKYSDWAISHVVCRLRQKTRHLPNLKIETRKELGFALRFI